MAHGGREAQAAMPDGGRDVQDTMTHAGRGAQDTMAHGGRDVIAAEAIAGLHQMGFGRAEATRAVHEAMAEAHAATGALTLQAVLVGALRNLRTSRGRPPADDRPGAA